MKTIFRIMTTGKRLRSLFMALLGTLFHFQNSYAQMALTKQVVEPSFQTLLNDFSQLENEGRLTVYSLTGEKVTFSDLPKRIELARNFSIVTSEIAKVVPGFRLRMTSRLQGSTIALSVYDFRDGQVLGRTAILLDPSKSNQDVALKKIEIDNAVSHLATQVEMSLHAQKKLIAKSNDLVRGKVANWIGLFLPKAQASGAGELGLFLLGLFGGFIALAVCIAIFCVFMVFIGDMDSDYFKEKYGAKHPFSKSSFLLGVVKVVTSAGFAALFAVGSMWALGSKE